MALIIIDFLLGLHTLFSRRGFFPALGVGSLFPVFSGLEPQVYEDLINYAHTESRDNARTLTPLLLLLQHGLPYTNTSLHIEDPIESDHK